MHDIRRIDIQENILAENDHIAEHINEHMGERGILVVNEMGAPGVGKTTSIKNLVAYLEDAGIKPYVIEGDIESDIDTQDLAGRGISSYQINTYGACHLDSPMIEHGLGHMNFERQEERAVLFIENIGNLVCPAEFSIGEHVKLLISTVTEGSDKPYKYPLAFENADMIILNKCDLIPYLDFDEDFFMKGVRALNKEVPVFKVSGKTGEGFAEAAQFLIERAQALAINDAAAAEPNPFAHHHSQDGQAHYDGCCDHDHAHSHGHSHSQDH